jgi:CRISPR-associated endonuclease/helicase Cas3
MWEGVCLDIWGKLPKEGEGPYHPLICHMLDTGHVAAALWEGVLKDGLRSWFAAALGVDQDAAGRWLAFWASLHDMGKATPAFQFKAKDPSICRALAEGLGQPRFWAVSDAHHGEMTTRVLPGLLADAGGGEALPRVSASLAGRVATAVGGHHGTFPSPIADAGMGADALGGERWHLARRQLFRALAAAFGVKGELSLPASFGDGHAFFLGVAGLVSVADWVASCEAFFPYVGSISDLDAYARRHASAGVRRAFAALGWSHWDPPKVRGTFKQLFPRIDAPRPLQETAVALAEKLTSPTLVVIEAPTGEGKTEAAMFLADHWAATLKQRGCYFALPTQATSNQMFTRICQFLGARYPDERVNLQLLHGHAALSAEFAVLQRNASALPALTGVHGENGYDGAPANVVAAEWFTHRKRGLLSPFGVGTIDQALLAVLQARHVFVRLFGLAGKTVIIDEVHAYDAYMSSLLARLLEWLAALGCSVVLLSATLPESKRRALLNAYAKGLGHRNIAIEERKYPRISWLAGGAGKAEHVLASPAGTKTLRIEWFEDDLHALGERLKTVLAGGGCAAVICNTVGRAQEAYDALKPFFPDRDARDGLPELDLLHGRYLYRDRQEREKRTLRRFGHPEATVDGQPVCRPHRAVLVATQIIEQSLDVDFDLMVSEVAPADLLLQRAGRLCRHDRGPRQPALWVCGPKTDPQGRPDFGSGTEWVYDRHALLRTWVALGNRERIEVPQDVPTLIEAVYDVRPAPVGLSDGLRGYWEETQQEQARALKAEEQEAMNRWIPHPQYTGALWRMTADPREEDAPDFHRAHQALTRLAPPSVRLVCLWERDGRLYAEPDGTAPVTIRTERGHDTAKALLVNSVSISDPRVVAAAADLEAPCAWTRNSLLRHHRLVRIGEDGMARVGPVLLRLDPEKGVFIERRGKETDECTAST